LADLNRRPRTLNDDLDEEIDRKRRKGYPGRQHRSRGQPLRRPAPGLGAAGDRRVPQGGGAVSRGDLPQVVDALREKIDDACIGNPGFGAAAGG
jgi:hypothetical protein